MTVPTNPLAATPPDATRSAASLAGHPLHPMLVIFPIAYLTGTLWVAFPAFILAPCAS